MFDPIKDLWQSIVYYLNIWNLAQLSSGLLKEKKVDYRSISTPGIHLLKASQFSGD